MAHLEVRNRILAHLPGSEYKLLETHLEVVDLTLRMPIERPHKPVTHLYFVEQGLISVVATGPRRTVIEVGVIGREGCSGFPFILGATRSPLDTYVQIAGHARRLECEQLAKLLPQAPRLQRMLHQAAYAFALQVAYTALANGHARLEQRLARWLLMAQDRVSSDEIRLTHEFLALMLGVRRPGVTVALAALSERRLVRIKRGAIVIVSRAGLENLADKFYGTPEAENERMFD